MTINGIRVTSHHDFEYLAVEENLLPLRLHPGHGHLERVLLGGGGADLLQLVDDAVQAGLDHVGQTRVWAAHHLNTAIGLAWLV